MTTAMHPHDSSMMGLQEKNQKGSAFGPFLRKQYKRSSTSITVSSSSSSSPSKSSSSSSSHKRSDSRATISTAASSPSAESQQNSNGERSNSPIAKEEESNLTQYNNIRRPQHDDDPEQPPTSNSIEEGGILQQVMDGMANPWSTLLERSSVLQPSSPARVELSFGGGDGESKQSQDEEGMEIPFEREGPIIPQTTYRSQPPPPMPFPEEEKKDDGDAKFQHQSVKSSFNAKQEEEARIRFDLLKDLVMMGETGDEISPPNRQPLQEHQPPPKKKSLLVQAKKQMDDGYVQRVKKMARCAALLLVLLGVLIAAIFMVSNHVQQQNAAAAALAASSPPPTTSMAPSTAPSISQMPSIKPTNLPTGTPTKSQMPTQPPSLRPSASKEPSQIPTISQIPSVSPSWSPSTSKQPTEVPSELPSLEPSMSMMPSLSTISPDYSFKVRLYWEQSYFWQEEKAERWWCLECVRCANYGGGDGNEHGCRSYSTGNEGVCQQGDSIWIRDCRDRANRFNVLENRKSGFMLRVATTNLCITRERARYLKLDHCDRGRIDQQFVPWQNYDKFELRPLTMDGWSEREADCVSQLHHPKQDELISLHNCRLCRIYETRYWQVYLG